MNNGIIAFCGPKGSGKSTSAEAFQYLYSGPTEELAFAGHLKASCSKVFNVPLENFLKPELKEVEFENYVILHKNTVIDLLNAFDVKDPDYDKLVRPHVGQVMESPRRLLQYIGTEVLHPIDPLIHAKMTLALKDPNKLSLITDLRFVNEFEYLRQTRPDFMPVFVKNSIAEYKITHASHKSETEVLLFKHKCLLVDNNSTIPELRKNLEAFIKANL